MSTKPSSQPPILSLEQIAAAHERIAPRIHRTPVLQSATIDALCGAKIFFKCENLQKTGSFKIRGATNAIFSLSEREASHGIVTHSSGNHGAAVACAAGWRGVPAWIVMPKNAPIIKCQAVEAYGGKIINIHPSLLPSFPGKDAVGQALEAGVKVTGVTIHYVDAGMDTGPIIAQEAVVVSEGDTRESLQKKIQQVEHKLYVNTVNQIVQSVKKPTVN